MARTGFGVAAPSVAARAPRAEAAIETGPPTSPPERHEPPRVSATAVPIPAAGRRGGAARAPAVAHPLVRAWRLGAVRARDLVVDGGLRARHRVRALGAGAAAARAGHPPAAPRGPRSADTHRRAHRPRQPARARARVGACPAAIA